MRRAAVNASQIGSVTAPAFETAEIERKCQAPGIEKCLGVTEIQDGRRSTILAYQAYGSQAQIR